MENTKKHKNNSIYILGIFAKILGGDEESIKPLLLKSQRDCSVLLAVIRVNICSICCLKTQQT